MTFANMLPRPNVVPLVQLHLLGAKVENFKVRFPWGVAPWCNPGCAPMNTSFAVLSEVGL